MAKKKLVSFHAFSLTGVNFILWFLSLKKNVNNFDLQKILYIKVPPKNAIYSENPHRSEYLLCNMSVENYQSIYI